MGLNKDEVKAQVYISRLRKAVKTNDKQALKTLESSNIDWSNVRQSMLDEVDELQEHPNYSDGLS